MPAGGVCGRPAFSPAGRLADRARHQPPRQCTSGPRVRASYPRGPAHSTRADARRRTGSRTHPGPDARRSQRSGQPGTAVDPAGSAADPRRHPLAPRPDNRPARRTRPDRLDRGPPRAQHHTPELASWDPGRLQASSTPTIAADDGNRIIAANAAAAELLGWQPGDLIGQRITAIIPEHLRERHIAAFTSLLLTGEPHILGCPVTMPALHHDGRLV
ncbi:PAS domain S-box protein [Streptomyces sp. NPDC004561]